jgi:rhodanese-related sulfurtransferase
MLLAMAAVAPAFAAPQEKAAPATEESARRISATEARQALADGKAVLVDVRPKEAYDMSHAQGAISVPLSDLGSRLAELPKDKLVITYCT